MKALQFLFILLFLSVAESKAQVNLSKEKKSELIGRYLMALESKKYERKFSLAPPTTANKYTIHIKGVKAPPEFSYNYFKNRSNRRLLLFY